MKLGKKSVGMGVISSCVAMGLVAVMLVYNSCGEANFDPQPSISEGRVEILCEPGAPVGGNSQGTPTGEQQGSQAGAPAAAPAGGGGDAATRGAPCYVNEDGVKFTASTQVRLKITPPSSSYKKMQLGAAECLPAQATTQDEADGANAGAPASGTPQATSPSPSNENGEPAWQNILYMLPEYAAPFVDGKFIASVRFKQIENDRETLSACARDHVVYDGTAPAVNWAVDNSTSQDAQNLDTMLAADAPAQWSFQTSDAQSAVRDVRCGLKKLNAAGVSEDVLPLKTCAEHINSQEGDTYSVNTVAHGQHGTAQQGAVQHSTAQPSAQATGSQGATQQLVVRRHTVQYRNLPAGVYTFYVEVVDNVGHQSELQHSFTMGSAEQERPNMLSKTKSLSVEQRDNIRRVDILFVVDNSGSMGTYQTQLASNLQGFINLINGLDYRIAVTTTDSYVSGHALLNVSAGGRAANAYFITADDTNPEHILKYVVNAVGTKGSHLECGISSVYKRLQILRQRSSGSTASFLGHEFFRRDAHLVVIVLSDESATCYRSRYSHEYRQIASEHKVTPAQFLRAFADLKTQQGISGAKLVWHSMLSTNPVHQYGYKELSLNTGGVVGDLHRLYTPQLRRIGEGIQNLVNSTALECEPLPVLNGKKLQFYSMSGGVRAAVVTTKASCEAACAPGNTECIENCAWLEYSVNGRNVIFGGPLPAGDYEMDYYCAQQAE